MIAANYSPRSHVPSRKDILLLNILRCEPPSYKFDYYSYGGLPRSVMNSLRDFSLEELLQNKDSRVVNVGSVSTGEEKNAHVMRYSSMGNVRSVIVNAYNNNSAERDHKFWLELPLAGLMSLEPAGVITEKLKHLKMVQKSMGITLHEPFLQMAFVALPVIPSLKITDLGLVDVTQFKFINLENCPETIQL